jgi:DNA modification methylase
MQKPVDILVQMIEASCDEGDLIFDPFMGSGSSGVAAVKSGRRFVGIEINREIFDLACRRIEQAYAQPRLFEDAKVGAGETALQGDMLLPDNA